jgi:hypothetical protein
MLRLRFLFVLLVGFVLLGLLMLWKRLEIQFANDGLEAYYMEYEVMDQGVIKRVEEV